MNENMLAAMQSLGPAGGRWNALAQNTTWTTVAGASSLSNWIYQLPMPVSDPLPPTASPPDSPEVRWLKQRVADICWTP